MNLNPFRSPLYLLGLLALLLGVPVGYAVGSVALAGLAWLLGLGLMASFAVTELIDLIQTERRYHLEREARKAAFYQSVHGGPW